MKFFEKQPFIITVDVSASTEAFVGTVCLIAIRPSVLGRTGCRRLGSGQSHRQRRQQGGQMDQGGDTYQEGARQVDEQRRGVLPILPHLYDILFAPRLSSEPRLDRPFQRRLQSKPKRQQ